MLRLYEADFQCIIGLIAANAEGLFKFLRVFIAIIQALNSFFFKKPLCIFG